jgi:hydrogenase nickel incorporation protein HypA/HybF
VHELGLLRSVVAAVAKAAADAQATSVEAVGLRVGSLSGAVPEALEGAWPLAIDGTALHGARLDIETVEAAVYCPTCDANQPIDEFFALLCPVCRSVATAIVPGSKDFTVVYADMDVARRDGFPGSTAAGHD